MKIMCVIVVVCVWGVIGQTLAQEPKLLIEKSSSDYALSWTGVAGVQYEIWYSIDLQAWTKSVVVRSGAGALSAQASVVMGSPLPAKAFFRIQWKQFVDTDNDGMDDSFEQFLVDSNTSDGINNIIQFLPSDDFDGDGIKNFDEYRYGLNSELDDANQVECQLSYVYQIDRLTSVSITGASSVIFTYDANKNLTSVQ